MNSLIKEAFLKNPIYLNQFVRHFRTKGVIKGKEPGVAPSIVDVIARQNAVDETVYYKVDIGLPYVQKISKKERAARQAHLTALKNNKDLERKARRCALEIPLEDVADEWLVTNGPEQIRRIAEHYGVFQDLFGDAYFYPLTKMNIAYKLPTDEYAPIYYGNHIKPDEAKEAPVVEIEPKANTLHTLVLCDPDGHLNTPDMEYVHWLVGNIPNGDISKGETIFEYLQPFPTHGSGYHRLVFVLYEHEQKIDYSNVPVKPKKSFKPPDYRNFKTYNFYRERQDLMTPCSLAFFQSDWDSSVTKLFHKIFNMTEPWYEYDFPKLYGLPQRWWPEKKPFNTYLDRYRDKKEISEELLKKKLKTHHPFVKPDPPLKFPHLHTPHDSADKPSWLQVEIKKERLGWGHKINDNLDMLFPK